MLQNCVIELFSNGKKLYRFIICIIPKSFKSYKLECLLWASIKIILMMYLEPKKENYTKRQSKWIYLNYLKHKRNPSDL